MSISATFLNTEFLQTALPLGSYTQILNFQPNYPNILLTYSDLLICSRKLQYPGSVST